MCGHRRHCHSQLGGQHGWEHKGAPCRRHRGQLAAAGRAGSRSARPVALLGAASMCLTSTWLAGDDLAFRYRTGQVLRFGGWLELAASVVLAAWGVQVLAGIVRRGRAERARAIATVRPPRKAAAR